MNVRSKPLASIATAVLAAALLITPFARGADPAPVAPKVVAPKPMAAVDLPPAALGEHHLWVLYVDVPALTSESFKAARDAVQKALPDQLMKGDDKKEMDSDSQAMLDMRKAWMDSGGEVLVLAGNVPGSAAADIGEAPQGAPAAKPDKDPKDAADPADADAGKGDAPPMVAFVRLKTGTTPKAFMSAFKVSGGKIIAAQKALHKDKEKPENDMDISKMDAVPWAGQWAYLKNDGLLVPKKAAAGKVAGLFASALGRQSGAPFRLAFRLDDSARAQLKEASANPNFGMVAGLIDPLMSLDTGTIAVTLGENPKLAIDLNFADADTAQQFKQGMDTLSGLATMLIQQGQAAAAQKDPNAPKLTPQQLKATLAPLTFKQTEGNLSTQFDTKFLKNLKDTGVLNNIPMGGGGGDAGPGDPNEPAPAPAAKGAVPKKPSKPAPEKDDGSGI